MTADLGYSRQAGSRSGYGAHRLIEAAWRGARVMNRPLIGTVALALFFTLLVALRPVAAQVATSNGQQSAGRAGQSSGSQGPTTGVICIEEMTATFCNVVTGPSSGGYGSSGGSGSSAGARSNTSSIPPCSAFPPANELCN
jgi:hypothetical protein